MSSPHRAHPPALRMLFFTEMWERFSYYGMRALLVLYLVNALGYARADALALYGLYTALVYLTPILGGYLADRYLGTRKAILIGGMTMAMGHFAMAIPGFLHLALGLLVVGNGFFKPSIGALLGGLYARDDARRDGGFIFFYMGVNLGAFLAPLIAGTLGEKIGWHYGFAAAGVGMCCGLAQFIRGQHRLGNAGLVGDRIRLGKRDWLQAVFLSLAMLPTVLLIEHGYGWLQPYWQSLDLSLQALLICGIIVCLWWAANRQRGDSQQRLSSDDWRRIAYIAIISLFVIAFWMGFEQAGGTMNLFADKQTDRMLLGWEIPASYFQSVNPLIILLIGPLMAAFWTALDASRHAISTPVKMAIGMLLLGAGFGLLALADAQAQALGKVSALWLIAVYLLHTLGEMCLSPIGIAMVTNIAPARLVALLLGLWYAAISIANYMAGSLETWLQSSGWPIYGFLLASSTGAAVLLLLVTPWLNRLVRGR